jgi:hypothetical protein
VSEELWDRFRSRARSGELMYSTGSLAGLYSGRCAHEAVGQCKCAMFASAVLLLTALAQVLRCRSLHSSQCTRGRGSSAAINDPPRECQKEGGATKAGVAGANWAKRQSVRSHEMVGISLPVVRRRLRHLWRSVASPMVALPARGSALC